VFKTRSQATHACTLGRVQVNGDRAKPHRHLHLDDKVEVDLGDWQRVLIVRELRDRPVAKAEAAKLYEDLSGPRPVLDAIDRAMRRPPVKREKGLGRPTKQQRRAMEKFLRER
jgi:ribosome-associated heat shock protein Hsp15